MRSNSSRSASRAALGDRLGVVAEARGHRRRRGEVGRAVAAPLGLGLLQRRAQAHRDQRVLERRPRGVVHVDVAGRHARRRRAARRARRASGCAPGRGARTAAAARPGSGRGRRRRPAAAPAPPPPPRRRRVAFRRARSKRPASAPSRAQPERQTSPSARSLERAQRQGGGEGLAVRAPGAFRVGLGDQPAEVPPAVASLDEQREMERRRPWRLGRRHVSARRRRSAAPRAPCRPGRTPSPPRRRRGR